jgi:CubicO group peptidase (beta-lactamase class C family)
MKKYLFILLIPFTLSAQKNYTKLLDQYMQAQHSVKGFTGTVLVMQKDKVLLRKSFGLSDREWNIPNSTETKYQIGSVTKQFTAACILQLVEQGKLSLDDKLNKFLPSFPKGDSVSIQMLLNHSSGIANYTAQKDFGKLATQHLSKDSMIAFFANKPYTSSPGKKFQYTNSGYFLLGYIIEKISGQSYAEYLTKNIFLKIGMQNTFVNEPDSIVTLRAHGYAAQGKKIVNATVITMDWPFSAGAIVSTVDDLYLWDRALYQTTVLSEASKQKMFSAGLGNYGDGFQIDSLSGHPRIWHNGSIPGFFSNISRYVQDNLCVIVLSNTTVVQNNTLPITDVLAEGMANIVFNQEVEIPYLHKEVKIDPSLLDKFVGKYDAGLVLEVIKKDNKLYRHRTGSVDIELKPESNTKFFYADESNRQLEFTLDAKGNVVKIWFINNEQKGEMKKVVAQ